MTCVDRIVGLLSLGCFLGCVLIFCIETAIWLWGGVQRIVGALILGLACGGFLAWVIWTFARDEWEKGDRPGRRW